MTPTLPSHEEIELRLFRALGPHGGWVDADTSVESLALGSDGRASLARALNHEYDLELGGRDLERDEIRTLADIVLLVRLHLIQAAVEIDRSSRWPSPTADGPVQSALPRATRRFGSRGR